MEKLVNRFIAQVNDLITVERERESLFDALKRYQSSSDLKKLIQDLKRLLNEPEKLEIYEFVRPLVRPQHQQRYDKLAPAAPGKRTRVIKLRRHLNESLGFAVRGGFEYNIGIFVSHVEPGSQAELQGLRVGDEIVRVNGFTISEAIHEEVLNLIKGREEIELKVTHIGMLPVKKNETDPVSWQYVDKSSSDQQQAKPAGKRVSGEPDGETVKLFINLRGATGLGCSIVSGPKNFPGIFIESVKPDSLGEDYGLEVGDQLIEVNGRSFHDIQHKEALVELKGNKELNMVIKKGAGNPLLGVTKPHARAGPPSTQQTPPQRRRSPAPPSPTMERKQVTITPDSPVQIEPGSEIMDESQYAVVEKRKQDDEQIKLRRKREQELVKEEYRRREMERQMEEEIRKQEEELRRQEEEEMRRKEAEELRRQEEIRAREEQARREEEEERQRQEEIDIQKQQEKRYKKAKKREKENEFYRRVRLHQQEVEMTKRNYFLLRQQELESLRHPRSAILAGRSAPSRSMKPTLLGAETKHTTLAQAGNKGIVQVTVSKEDGQPLDIELEGGVGSPLGGKIVVADVFFGGAAYQNGQIKRGDQVVSVNGKSLVDVTLSEAQNILWDAEQSPGTSIKLAIVESGLRGVEDEMYKGRGSSLESSR